MLFFLALGELTAINIANNINSASVEGNETKREDHAHSEAGMVCSSRKACDHCRFEADRQHTTDQPNHYERK
jgi:hypothetical protein